MRVLIAEDDRPLGSFLQRGLASLGYEVEVAHDGELALDSFFRCEPDLLLLDLELPGRPGPEVLRVIRELSPLCPVLVLSARADAETRIRCLGEGADDCMAKPFSLAELRARCGALLRRHQAVRELLLSRGGAGESPSTLALGTLTLQRVRRQVHLAGAPVRLTNCEFALLEQLLLAGGAPVGRAALRASVWEAKEIESNALDVHIAALRRKLAGVDGAPAIETVRGAGYRMVGYEGQGVRGRALAGSRMGSAKANSLGGEAWL